MTERHFFAAANQLLIIVDAGLDDAGKYTCIMSNTLGTERGHIYLNVISSPNCDSAQSSMGHEDDGWTTVGIVIIVVVCCVVGTSLIWVIVIYHMRRKNVSSSSWLGLIGPRLVLYPSLTNQSSFPGLLNGTKVGIQYSQG